MRNSPEEIKSIFSFIKKENTWSSVFQRNTLITGTSTKHFQTPPPPTTWCEACIWKVPLLHSPPACIQTWNQIPDCDSTFLSPEFQAFLRDSHPKVIVCHFFKMLAQTIAECIIQGMLNSGEVALRESSRAALDNAAFRLSLLQHSAWQKNKIEIHWEREPRWRCSEYWWKRQPRGLWQRIIGVSSRVSLVSLWLCAFPFWAFTTAVFTCSSDYFQILTSDTSMWAFAKLDEQSLLCWREANFDPETFCHVNMVLTLVWALWQGLQAQAQIFLSSFLL